MTLPVVLYILGAPGVGKTTLARSLLGWEVDPLFPGGKRFPRPDLRLIQSEGGYKWTQQGSFYAAGHYTGEPFDGADTVGYTQALATLGYWKAKLVKSDSITILDGDRFSTAPSLKFLQDMPGLRIIGVHLVASPELLAARRVMRESVTKKAQNETWVKGRVTKAANFARRIKAFEMDASLPLIDLHSRVSVLVFGSGSMSPEELEKVARA